MYLSLIFYQDPILKRSVLSPISTKRIFLLLKTDYISIKSKDSSNYSTTNVLCLIYNQLGK
jgi:hypothetical protein